MQHACRYAEYGKISWLKIFWSALLPANSKLNNKRSYSLSTLFLRRFALRPSPVQNFMGS